MKIQVNTDRNIEGNEALVQLVEAEVQYGLERFDDRLTRVEVHLGDESGEKDGSGADKRCLLEARPTGMQPVVVTEFADTVEQAVVGSELDAATVAAAAEAAVAGAESLSKNGYKVPLFQGLITEELEKFRTAG